MNHTITIGGLLAVSGAFGGLIVAAVGLLMIFAGGMSDASDLGTSISNKGCAVAVIGVILLALGIYGLLA